MKDLVKKYTPKLIISIALRLRKLFVYKDYDSSLYWKSRAKESGQAAVLWQNQEYNKIYRNLQGEMLSPYVISLEKDSRMLDIGCGIGIVSKMLLEMNNAVRIDAVDFPEMIHVAKKNINHKNINFIENSAENYINKHHQYDLIISSGCYSAIRNIDKLEQAIINGSLMLKPKGKIIMIDPFHRWNYLARAKYGTQDVVNLMKKHNMSLEHKSGMLFWPFREWLANSRKSGKDIESKFYLGERLLKLLGKHFWADYKILVFRKVY